MAWQWIALALALSGVLLAASLQLHRTRRTAVARAVDIAGLAWLFYLVHLFEEGPKLLQGALVFLGCFHLGLLMGWVPIRRSEG